MKSKAFRVILYENGNALTPGVRILLNHRTCQSFSQLLRLVADTMKLQTSVRRLYNAKNGRPITNLRELEDGMSIACAGTGMFRRAQYKPKTPVSKGQASHGPDGVHNSHTSNIILASSNSEPLSKR
jgi:hypothetical protein